MNSLLRCTSFFTIRLTGVLAGGTWPQPDVGLSRFAVNGSPDRSERSQSSSASIALRIGTLSERRDFRGLAALADAVGKRFVRGVVLYTGEVSVPFGQRLHALPIHCLWA